VKFGIHIANFGSFGDPSVLAGLAADAEASGWNGFFVWDHVLGDASWRTPMVDPWISLAAIATATKQIRLGALVTAVPRRRPWQLARETTTLDHLSGGRLVVGVGLGNPAQAEFEHFGEDGDIRRRARRLDEGLAILDGLWSGEPFAFHGEEYDVRETVFLPTPIQRPRPPVWVAVHGTNRGPVRRAARWDGAFPEDPTGRRLTPEAVAMLLADISDQRQAGGPYDMVIAGQSDDLADGELAAYEAAGVTWWLEAIWPDVVLVEARGRIRSGVPRRGMGDEDRRQRRPSPE
jgi:alkanesulfonate monooxygenase SsuD/methylene tetrahydromethanopterin reductase-like flavin-dependent oxidoreductase (luciferase family)